MRFYRLCKCLHLNISTQHIYEFVKTILKVHAFVLRCIKKQDLPSFAGILELLNRQVIIIFFLALRNCSYNFRAYFKMSDISNPFVQASPRGIPILDMDS